MQMYASDVGFSVLQLRLFKELQNVQKHSQGRVTLIYVHLRHVSMKAEYQNNGIICKKIMYGHS